MDNILSPEKLTHTWLEDTLALLFGTLMISFGIILFRQAGALTCSLMYFYEIRLISCCRYI